MKRVFKFKQGQYWDGDEDIINCIEKYLDVHDWKTHNSPMVKKNTKITIIMELN